MTIRTLVVGITLLWGMWAVPVMAQSPYGPERWMVASGMGGCGEVSSIAGEVSDLPKWSGPEEFVNALRGKGYQVSTVTAEYEGRYLVKVVVPARHVDTVFLPLSLCRKMFQEELDRKRR